jgi:hypothetical protein
MLRCGVKAGNTENTEEKRGPQRKTKRVSMREIA